MSNEVNYDWRDMQHGNVIPSENYTDQPYIIKADDGAWLCTMTTCCGHEGQKGQHVVTLRSVDKGRTWGEYRELEPSDGPESAYSVLLKIPTGRVFAFYAYNSQNIREVPADPGPTFNGRCRRVDCLGDFVFRYSDDHGRSWSEQRYVIDVREMTIDRENVFGGRIRFFWNVGKPFFHKNGAFVPLIKVGGFGEGCYTRTEGVLLKCVDIESSEDPGTFRWKTLPDGDAGLKTPPGGGLIAEEQSYSVLSDGSFFCVYRSVDGHPVCAYSRDGGHTWSQPEYMTYADGRLIKHPRAANFAWKCANGKFLYWFHNHGGKCFDGRNPAWICAGDEADTPHGRVIKWSQPDILLYDKAHRTAMSYPDMIEDGSLYITETQKSVARCHEIDASFIEKLWRTFDRRPTIAAGWLLEYGATSDDATSVTMPLLPEFVVETHCDGEEGVRETSKGFSIELLVNTASLSPGDTLLDGRAANGAGLVAVMGQASNMEINLNDGTTGSKAFCDPEMFFSDSLHHIMIIVDGGPRTISFVIDGKFNDGGTFKQFGWSCIHPLLRHANGNDKLFIGPHVERVRIYPRVLMNCEAVGNHMEVLSKNL